MEAVQEKKKGNPNFGKKSKFKTLWDNIDANKTYTFQLTEKHTSAKGVDGDTGELATNPYPLKKWIPNEGVATDPETGELRRWRYVYGFPIWLDEQMSPKLEPTKNQLENLGNLLMFDNGYARIEGKDKAKVQAFLLSDSFEGAENPVKRVPKVFRLIDHDLELLKTAESTDVVYEALKFAKEASLDDILPVALALGIDVTDPKRNEDKIKASFKIKAMSMPDVFMKQVVNPKNDIKYNVTKGLKSNVISSTMIENKLVYTATNTVALEVNTNGDIAEQVAVAVISGDKEAVKLNDFLKRYE